MKKVIIFSGFLFIFLLASSISEAATVYNFQGKLTDKTGKAVTAKTQVTFRIFKTPTGGKPVWTEQKEVTPNSQGRLQADLGETSLLKLAPGNYYMEVQIGREIMSPRYSIGAPSISLEIYERFLRDNPAIRRAIVWQNYVDDPRLYYYDDWTPEMKNGLFNYLRIYEGGGTYPYSGPPEPKAGSTIHDTLLYPADSWNLYLANIAFSLYVEVNRLTAWSITTYTSEQLAPLFNNLQIFGTRGTELFFHECTAWNPKFCYDFLVARDLIKREPTSTIHAFTGWARKYIRHSYSGGPPETAYTTEYYSYNGAPPVDRILTPRWTPMVVSEGMMWTSFIWGCHTVTALFKAVLRSINISTKEEFWLDERDRQHSRIIFLTSPINYGVIHSDDLTNWPGYYTIPTIALFRTKGDLERSYSSPPLTVEQLRRNITRYTYLRYYSYPMDMHIVSRARELRSSSEGGLLHDLTDGADHLTVEEATDLIRRIDSIITYHGGPDGYLRASREYITMLYSTPP